MILENLVLVIGLIGLGSMMKRSTIFPHNTSDVLNKFVLNIALPAIIVISISTLKVDLNMIIPVGIHWAAFIFHILLIFLVSKWLGFSKKVLGALLIVSTLGNTAFLGIPMIKTFFGEKALSYGVLYDQLGSGIGYIIMGAFVLPLFTGEEKKSTKDVFVGLLKFPPFVALILGFAFIYVPLPFIFHNFLSSIAATLVPCAMIAVGFQMKYRLPRTTLLPLGVGLWIKLIIIPLFSYLLITLVDNNSLAAKTSVLQSGMPPMITAGAMAISAKLEEDLCASLVGYGLIFSFISLYILKMFL